MANTRTSLFLLTALASSVCFNVDTDKPTIFSMDRAGFGHSVAQYSNSWVVVGAPQEIRAANQTGGLYQCDYRTGTCEPIHLQVPQEAVNMSLGLSLTAATKPFQLLACGPTVHQTCRENVYLTGFCFFLVPRSRQSQRLPSSLQECPRQEQDIVFLIDGSGSIDFRDFAKMLSFVKAVMSQFQRPSAQFSLMQFSDKFLEHFTFKEFMDSSDPLGLLDSVHQLKGYTHTATAIQKATNELFSASKGARKDASKILIVITDGEKTGDHLRYDDVIPAAEAAGILRYAVGVGSAFQKRVSWKELIDIASRPSQEYIFKVENFDALRDIQNQLKDKIFAIEESGPHVMSSNNGLLDISLQLEILLKLRTSRLGISPSHSQACPSLSGQRIAGSQLSPRLQYFGQSLSGGQDLTQDGLVDLAVGARGHALLLRTRPVLRVWASIRTSPTEISRSMSECREQTPSFQTLGDATVCLHVYESARNQLGNLKSSVTFDLTLDPGRLSPRAIFKETRARNLTRTLDLGLSQHCEDVALLLSACVEDSVTPIILRLNFSLVGKPILSFGNLQPMLAADAPRYFTTSLPFEKNCGADHVCQDDLGISFGLSGLKSLVVGTHVELTMEVTVWNDGEDSYGTTVTFSYPLGLSYRRVAGSQNQMQSRSLPLTCDNSPAGSQGTRSTHCSIKHLILREGAQITFTATFDVSPKAELGDRLLLTANVSSENNSPRTSKSTSQLELPVTYAIYVVASSHEESTKYLNFSASEEKESSVAQHRYQVNNLGSRDLPVSINFLVPMELNQVPVWTDIEVSHPQNPSIQCSSQRIAPIESNFLTHIQENRVLNCSVADCLRATLYKVGFFKRQYKEMMEEANGQTAPENGTPNPQVAQ
nr:PREDICTED: integrin alpha-X-like [Rhinolophus sinicus]